MNVSHTIDAKNNGVISIEIAQSDFSEKVEKSLSDYRKRANIPCFRQGMAPMTMIRKQYEYSVRVDEVNKLLQDGLYNYLESEKLEILGQPLPMPSQVDFMSEKFEVKFEIGVAPSFDLDISEKVKLPYVEIEPTKSVLDEEVDNIRNRYGKMSEVEAVGAEDILFGGFQMVDKKGQPVEGTEVKEGRVGVKSISDKKVAKAAIAMTKGETLELNASKHFMDSFALEEVLGLTEIEQAVSTGLFVLTLKTIYHLEPAEINQELFDKLFGEGEVSSEAEMRGKIEDDLKRLYQRDSDTHFFNTVTDHLMKTKMNLPAAFMKKWITQQGENAPNMDEVEEQWPNTEKAMRWQLIEGTLVREHHLHVHKEELAAHAVEMVKSRMAQFGQAMDDEQAEQLAMSVLQNREQSEQLSEQLLQDKMMAFFKGAFSLKTSKSSYADFLKLANSKK